MEVTLHRFKNEHDDAHIACIKELVWEHNPFIHLSLQDCDDAHILAWIKQRRTKELWHQRSDADVMYYWICNKDEVVGIATLKKQLPMEIYKDSGHIGICIRQSRRRAGYAKKTLILLIKEAYTHYHIHDILLCCNYENTICRKLCESVHAVLKHEDTYCHYWISEHVDQINEID